MLKNLDKSITALRLGREGHLHLRDELRRVPVGHPDVSPAGNYVKQFFSLQNALA